MLRRSLEVGETPVDINQLYCNMTYAMALTVLSVRAVLPKLAALV